VKLLFDESLSPRLVELLSDLFPESESALRNGLARAGDLKILEYASAGGFVLVSTDGDLAHSSVQGSSFSVPVIIRPRLPPKCFAETQFVSLSCKLLAIVSLSSSGSHLHKPNRLGKSGLQWSCADDSQI
jgi:predicted nuclease of predicted toxin-antitoxin system